MPDVMGIVSGGLNTVFNPILSIDPNPTNPALTVLIIAFIVSLLTTIANKYLVDQEKMNEIQERNKEPEYAEEVAQENEPVESEKSQEAVSKVIMGVSAGMIIGVPITTFLATNIGYEASMLFFSAVNLIALIATILIFPSIPGKKHTYGSQVSVAKSGIFIISVLGIIFLNGGLYAAYGYISEFLNTMTHIFSTELSIVLFIYGVFSIIGNWLGAKLLNKSTNKTVLITPIATIIILLGMFYLGNLKIPTIIIMAFWGLLAGIVNDISQYWMVSAAPEAPEFANGIFLSMGNVGITLGTSIAGFVVISAGVKYTMITAAAIMIITIILLYTRTRWFNASKTV